MTKKDGPQDKRVETLYHIMQSIESRLGGGEGVEGIYGSITQMGMQRIFDSMRRNCSMDSSSVLVDVGAGLGRPLLHALVEHGICGAFGIELDSVKVAKAHAFVRQSLDELARRQGVEKGEVAAVEPEIRCTSIENVPSLDPATHAYSFWEGVPLAGKQAFGRLFAASKTLKGVTVVQRAVRGQEPAAMMHSLGFGPLLLISNFAVKMSGSGRSFQAYVFCKPQPQAIQALHGKLQSPAPATVAAVAADAVLDGAEVAASAAVAAALAVGSCRAAAGGPDAVAAGGAESAAAAAMQAITSSPAARTRRRASTAADAVVSSLPGITAAEQGQAATEEASSGTEAQPAAVAAAVEPSAAADTTVAVPDAVAPTPQRPARQPSKRGAAQQEVAASPFINGVAVGRARRQPKRQAAAAAQQQQQQQSIEAFTRVRKPAAAAAGAAAGVEEFVAAAKLAVSSALGKQQHHQPVSYGLLQDPESAAAAAAAAALAAAPSGTRSSGRLAARAAAAASAAAH